jgi:hypothetical protein
VCRFTIRPPYSGPRCDTVSTSGPPRAPGVSGVPAPIRSLAEDGACMLQCRPAVSCCRQRCAHRALGYAWNGDGRPPITVLSLHNPLPDGARPGQDPPVSWSTMRMPAARAALQLGGPSQGFDLALAPTGCPSPCSGFTVHQPARATPSGLFGPPASLMRGQAPGEMRGDAGREAAIRACQHVDRPVHSALPSFLRATVAFCLLPTSPRESRFPMAYRHPYASNPMIWRSI